MERETAKRASELLLEASGCLDESIASVEENSSEAEFAAYREALSKILTDLWFEVLKPIYVEHSDLEPDGVKNQCSATHRGMAIIHLRVCRRRHDGGPPQRS